jgi:hypothetical protein
MCAKAERLDPFRLRLASFSLGTHKTVKARGFPWLRGQKF